MYNKNKKRTHECEDAPPEKKLVSEADLYIKKLAQKQRNTTINLEEQLSLKNSFCKSTELVSLTSFASGSKSLQEFSSLVGDVKNLEELKSSGLTDDEIELVQCYQNRHKKINQDVLNTQLGVIFNKLNNKTAKEQKNISRLESELLLATKPTSVETKLLKFALENEQKNNNTQVIPSPMDGLKNIEQQLMTELAPVNVTKIRKKARRLAKQINSGNPPLVEPKIIKTCVHNTKWDLKNCPQSPVTKTYTCDKPPNYYTIKEGQIVQIINNKLSIEEIRNLPKFQNYDKGTPSNVLFLKNLANSVGQNDLETIFQKFSNEILSIRVMTGRMQGQAFIEVIDEKTAGEMLGQFNGLIVKNKPIIIQFGRKKTVKCLK